MSYVDLFITAEDAERESRGTPRSTFDPIPEDTYDFVISDVQVSQTSKGRPRLSVKASVINHPQYNGRVVFYSCPLPWKPNGSSDVDTSGIGLLMQLFKGVGLKWSGTSFDTESLIGLAFRAKVAIRQRMRDGLPVDGVYDNQITRIFPVG